MSLHEEIEAAIHIEHDKLSFAIDISPTTLALAVQHHFNGREIEPHIKYSSLEHLKQMARKVLRGRYDADSDESEAIQQEMFSGHLQNRYPIKHERDEDPIYKLRTSLTHEEAQWNCMRLRKSARARLEHADALQAWDENRGDLGVAA